MSTSETWPFKNGDKVQHINDSNPFYVIGPHPFKPGYFVTAWGTNGSIYGAIHGDELSYLPPDIAPGQLWIADPNNTPVRIHEVTDNWVMFALPTTSPRYLGDNLYYARPRDDFLDRFRYVSTGSNGLDYDHTKGLTRD